MKKEGILKVTSMIKSIEKNQMVKAEVALLVNPLYPVQDLQDETLTSVVQKQMRQSICRYMKTLYNSSSTFNEFKIGTKQFEETRFISDKLRKYYSDVKAHFVLRAFGKELSQKLRAYGVNNENLSEAQKVSIAISSSSQMNVYHIIPHDLQHTFIFKVVQAMMKPMSGEHLKIFKYALFMIFNVEVSADFARKFNERMTDVYEELGAGTVAAPHYIELIPVVREVKLLTIEEASEIEDIEDIEYKFVKASEEVELDHDFVMEIKSKKEVEKQ